MVETASLGPTPAGLAPDFDLERIMSFMAQGNPDWTTERLAQAEADYRAFMVAAKADPAGVAPPPPDADAVWHTHILLTRKYERDCLDYFGFYFHHPLEEAASDAGPQ